MTTEQVPDAQVISDNFSDGVASEADIIVLPEEPEPPAEAPELVKAAMRRYGLEETP